MLCLVCRYIVIIWHYGSMSKELHLTIAQNILRKRKERGFSQEELADLCGLHRTYIGAIERGERNLTVNTLAKVANALGCSAVDLLE